MRTERPPLTPLANASLRKLQAAEQSLYQARSHFMAAFAGHLSRPASSEEERQRLLDLLESKTIASAPFEAMLADMRGWLIRNGRA
ncbi:hypothetical protein LH464_22940 [Neorhizobium sp. T786]|uniref:hypothetical protein n=1 Tax=Pseudorhizobium xiangyangii TaxID=2883104 RepID=UPI001CFF995A|nr:hypothetical protein [Neorhizobium xiangyangii]MCB5205322.1 hypothetical protein [Neorhizobium xiangyangii]